MAVFTYEANFLWRECGTAVGLYGPGIIDSCSSFCYDPSKRREVWRHLTHSFAHDGLMHLVFSSLFTNLLFGIPVELAYGPLHTCALYFCGVLTTSLFCSVVKPAIGGIGGSAGSMALMGVLLTMNRHKMPKTKFFAALVVAGEPLGFIYLNYFHNDSVRRTKSMEIIFEKLQESDVLGHLVGFVTGILFGARIRRGVEDGSWKGHVLTICTFCWIAMITIVVLINVFAEDWFLPEESDLESALVCKSFCRQLHWEAHVGKPITFWEGLQETIKNEILPKRVEGTRELWSSSFDEQTIRKLRQQLELQD